MPLTVFYGSAEDAHQFLIQTSAAFAEDCLRELTANDLLTLEIKARAMVKLLQTLQEPPFTNSK